MKTLLSYSQNIKILSAALCLMTIFNYHLLAQDDGGVAIGDTLRTPDPSAILELFSEKKGFLPPRMTAAQIDSISEPAEGLIVYDTDNKRLLYYYEGWKDIGFWGLFEEDEVQYIGHAGPVIVMDTTVDISSGFSEGHLLYVLGKKGIFSSVTGDSVPDEFYTVNGFNVVFENNETGVFNTVMNTQTEGEGNTSGLTLYTSGAGEMTGGLNTEASYTGDGAGMVVGLISNAWVENPAAEVLAVGGVIYSTSEHTGINIGTRMEASGEDTRANFAAIIAANVPEEGSSFMDSIVSHFPERITIATLTHNEANDSMDFNIYAAGVAKNYFEGHVGIGTVDPQATLDIAGGVNASVYLVEGDTLALNNAWSASGDDIYYDHGNVHIGKVLNSTASLNVAGGLVAFTDTSFTFPNAYITLLKNDSVIISPDETLGGISTAYLAALLDTTSATGSLDTTSVFFAMAKTSQGLASFWTYRSDTLNNVIALKGSDYSTSGITLGSSFGEILEEGSPLSELRVHRDYVSIEHVDIDNDVNLLSMLNDTFRLASYDESNLSLVDLLSTGITASVFGEDTTQLFITEDGVGIGTATPTATLEIAGDLLVEEATASVLTVADELTIPTGAVDGYVLTSDGDGTASWEAPLMRHASVAVSSSQILNSSSTPIVLVSAPGSGKAIVPVKIIFRYTFGTTAYDGAGSAEYEIRMRNGATGASSWFRKSATGWSSTSSCIYEITPQSFIASDMSGTNALVENDDLVLKSLSNPATGDGTAQVEVFYMVIPY